MSLVAIVVFVVYLAVLVLPAVVEFNHAARLASREDARMRAAEEHTAALRRIAELERELAYTDGDLR